MANGRNDLTEGDLIIDTLCWGPVRIHGLQATGYMEEVLILPVHCAWEENFLANRQVAFDKKKFRRNW